MLKKKYLEEVKKLSSKELEDRIVTLKKKLISYKIKLKSKQKTEYHKIKQTKIQIAQILTLKTFYKTEI
uniref:Large ribosomal subunit protein uL29c n=1 Tax=Caloglossa intermedia TaxID=100879 RepID=A0A1Z1M6D7_9FLOR|nr:ribosomal protein L29 [Caloglossa intermedia]ARW61500.1 ribosomal protein L29 [Caloglossa intermedia]